MTYNTGNPVPSTDPRDLLDNTQALDGLVNGALPAYPDRKGVARKSWAGMEADFAAAQGDKEQRFQAFLLASGYVDLGDYAAGLSIAARNQVFRRDGEFYRAAAALELPYTMTGDWAVDGPQFVAVGDAVLRQDIESGTLLTAPMVQFQSSIPGAVSRSVDAELEDLVLIRRFGAMGDGVTDDTAAFATLEASVTGRVIDLHGLSYAVASIPAGNAYVNGRFIAGGVSYVALSAEALLSNNGDTGGEGTPYAGGILNLAPFQGRSTRHLYALLASQNSRAHGPSRAVAVGSIYCESKGNVSGNYSARQSLAWVPQSVNIASEECWVWGGFRGGNYSSIFSGCENESNANLGARSSIASGRNSVNIASVDAFAGRGGGARLEVVLSGNAVSSVSVLRAGTRYQVGDALVFSPRQSAGTGAVATVASVNASGGIVGITVSAGGTGYSGLVDATIDNGTGDFSGNFATTNGCVTSGEASANIGCNNQTTSGLRAASVASQAGVTSGQNAGQLAANASTASGSQSAVIASNGSVASSAGSIVLAGNNSEAVADGAVTIGRRTINNVVRSIAFGDGSSGGASTANRKFHVFSNGNVQAAGTITGSTIFADYAEYFENAAAGVIPLGMLVALEGRHVRPVQPGDDILGVVSATALLVAGDSPFTWSNRYLTGEFGEPLYHDIPDPDWESMIPDPDWPRYIPNPAHPVMDLIEMEDGTTTQPVASTPTIPNPEPAPFVPNPEAQPLIRVQVENPDFDPAKPNVPRSERPEEWSCIGLLGQVHVRVKGDVAAGDWVQAGADGVGQLSDAPTNLRCMEIRTPYDDTKGYAVAFCLLR